MVYDPDSTLSDFILICKFLLLDAYYQKVWQLIQHGDYALSTDLQDTYYIFSVVKHHCHIFTFCLATQISSMEDLPFWLATIQRVLVHLRNPYCSFANTRVVMLLFIRMISWS